MSDIKKAILNSKNREKQRKFQAFLAEMGVKEDLDKFLKDISTLFSLKGQIDQISGALESSLFEFQRKYEQTLAGAEHTFNDFLEKSNVKIADATKVAKGDQGEPGKNPTNGELLNLIKPLIPTVRDGKTPSNKKLLKLIKSAMPEVQDGYTPKEGIDFHVPSAEEIAKLVPEKELKPENLIALLESLTDNEKLKSLLIEVLKEHFRKIQKSIKDKRRVGGGGITELTATGAIDGANLDFTFDKKPTYIVADGVWRKENKGWTYSGNTATMAIPPFNDIYGIIK